MASRVDPAAFTNAFNLQRQLGAQSRSADQAEEMNALQLAAMRREDAAAREPKYDAQAFPKVGAIASQISSIGDPMQKRAAFKLAVQQNGALFDTMGMPHTEALARIDSLDDAGLQATLDKLSSFAPQGAATEVTAGNSLVRPDGKGGFTSVFTAPDKPGTGPDGFTLSPGQQRFDANGRPIASVAESAPKPDAGATFSQENTLRDEYDKQTGNYVELLNAADTLNTLGTNGSPAGDIAMVAAFMRAVDPGSRVTGAEQATAENAGGVPAVIRGYYNKLLGTGQLSEDQRADFMKQAGNLVVGRQRQYKGAREKFTNLAKRYNLNPANIIGDELTMRPAPRTPAPGAAPTATPSGATVSNW